ncbi:MAG: GbsR/MarR family transcriptional regulator [Acidobacteriota bacterium]
MPGPSSASPSPQEIRREFIQLWGQLGRYWGVPAGTARVYGWLLAHANGGDTDAIMSGLRMGRGTVSMACKELREWGLILSQPVPGGRRIRHHVETDLGKVIRTIILHRKQREWDPILQKVREWIPRLEAERSPEAAVFRERLRAIETCVGLVDLLVRQFLEGETLPEISLASLARVQAPGRRAPG